MKVDKPAALRVIAALSVIVIFTGGARELRNTGGGAADFPCGMTTASDVAIAIGEGATGSEIAEQLFAADVIKSSAAFFRLAVGDRRARVYRDVAARQDGSAVCEGDCTRHTDIAGRAVT